VKNNLKTRAKFPYAPYVIVDELIARFSILNKAEKKEIVKAIDDFIRKNEKWFIDIEEEIRENDMKGEKFIGFDKNCNKCPFRKCVKEILSDKK